MYRRYYAIPMWYSLTVENNDWIGEYSFSIPEALIKHKMEL